MQPRRHDPQVLYRRDFGGVVGYEAGFAILLIAMNGEDEAFYVAHGLVTLALNDDHVLSRRGLSSPRPACRTASASIPTTRSSYCSSAPAQPATKPCSPRWVSRPADR
jgi:hypothetical protein